MHIRRRWVLSVPLVLMAAWLILLNRFAPTPRPMDAAEPSIEDRARIIERDDRVPVDGVDELPYRAIGHIYARWGFIGFTGTGVLVGPNEVLTAAHCVYREEYGGWAEELTFTPARTNGYAPYGTAGAIRFITPREYVQQKRQSADIALVTLDRAIGDETGWMRVALAGFDPTYLAVDSAGYPADKEGQRMYVIAGSTGALMQDTLRIDLDATFGQSGSPIWIYDPNDGEPTVVATLVAELDFEQANLAVPVTMDLLEQLSDATQHTVGIAAASGTVDIVTGEPVPAATPLVVAPCGTGALPMVGMSCALLAGFRGIGGGRRRYE